MVVVAGAVPTVRTALDAGHFRFGVWDLIFALEH